MEHTKGFLHSLSASYKADGEGENEDNNSHSSGSGYMPGILLVSRAVFLSVIPGLLEYSATYQEFQAAGYEKEM